MDNILDKNIKFLETKGIIIDKNMVTDKVTYKTDMKGVTIPVLNMGGSEKHMYSTVDALEAVKVQVSKLDIKSGNVLVLFGSGLFYEAYEVMKKWKEPGIVLVIEPSVEVFNSNILHTELSLEVEIATMEFLIKDDLNYDDVMAFFVEHINYLNFLPTIFYGNLAFVNTYESIYLQSLKSIKEAILNLTINCNTLGFFNKTSTKKMGISIPAFYKKGASLSGLKGAYKGKPCVMVATGPSLKNNIELLKHVQDKVVIIAVYVALKVLEPLGIKPDFVVSIDAVQVLEKNHEEFGFEENLVICSSGNTDLVLKNRGENFIVSYQGYPNFFKYFQCNSEEIMYLSSGGSVANTSIDLAHFLGCSSVILLGQDLAFKGEETHAYYDKNTVDKKIERKKVKGYYGEDVESCDIFIKFKEWNEVFAKENSDEMKFINATEGGVYLENFEHISFQEAIDTYLTESFDSSYDKSLLEYPTVEDVDNIINMMDEEVAIYQKTLVKLREVIKNITKLKKAFEKEGNDVDLSKYYNDLKKLDKFDKFFDDNKENYSFTRLIQYVNVMGENNGFPFEYSEDRIIAEKNYNYYNKMLLTIEIGLETLTGSLKELKKVREEKYGVQ